MTFHRLPYQKNPCDGRSVKVREGGGDVLYGAEIGGGWPVSVEGESLAYSTLQRT